MMSKKHTTKQITSTPGSYRHTIHSIASAMEKTTRSKHPRGRKIIEDDQAIHSMEIEDNAAETNQTETNQPPSHHATPDDDALLDEEFDRHIADLSQQRTSTPLERDLARLCVDPPTEPPRAPPPPPVLLPTSTTRLQQLLKQNAFPEDGDQQKQNLDDQQQPSNVDTVIHTLLFNRRELLFNLEKLEHHHSYLHHSIEAKVLPTWLQTSNTTNIRPILATRTDITTQIDDATTEYHMKLATLLREHYNQTSTTLKEDLEKIDTELQTNMSLIDPEQTTDLLQTVTESVVQTNEDLKVQRQASQKRRQNTLRNLKRNRPDNWEDDRHGGNITSSAKRLNTIRHTLSGPSKRPTEKRTVDGEPRSEKFSHHNFSKLSNTIIETQTSLTFSHRIFESSQQLRSEQRLLPGQTATQSITEELPITQTRPRRRQRSKHTMRRVKTLDRPCTLSRTVRNRNRLDNNTAIDETKVTESNPDHGHTRPTDTVTRSPLTTTTPMKTTISTKTTTTRANKYILNRSNHVLTHTEMTLLDKGLAFVPTERKPNRHRLLQEFDNFTRRLRILTHASRWHEQHHDTNNEDENVAHIPGRPHPFRMKSKWNPPTTGNQALETYITRTRKWLTEAKPVKRIHQNLSQHERTALTRLTRRNDIIMKKADKGSLIVIEDKQTYIEKGLEQVHDPQTYRRLDKDPTQSIVKQINQTVTDIHKLGLLDRKTLQFLFQLKPSKVRTQQLYFLSKIHKTPVAYRPIVSGCSGPTEAISQFVDYLLKPIALTQNSYIRDSNDFISLIETTRMKHDAILVTIDVTSLYTNIPHKEGIHVCIEKLRDYIRTTDNEVYYDIGFSPNLVRITETFLTHILTNNIFEFNGEIYRQLFGVAMGTKVAPTFANLFMADLEERFLRDEPTRPLIWKRFIDDIYVIWEDTTQTLQHMMERLNSFHPTIKFTYTQSNTEAVFLDVLTYKGNRFLQNNILDCKTHFKITNRFQYLHYTSCHAPSTFRAVTLGEAHRFLRSTSDPTEYRHILNDHTKRLISRGYPKKQTIRPLSKLPFSKRRYLLKNTTHDKQQTQNTRSIFTTTFSPWFPNIKQLIHRQWQIMIDSDPQLESILGCHPPMIAYKRAKNISDHITRARLRGTSKPIKDVKNSDVPVPRLAITPVTTTCNHTQCGICHQITICSAIRSTTTGKSYPLYFQNNNTTINGRMTCASTNIIYVITCDVPRCHKQYVGQTGGTLRVRMRHHRNKLRSQDTKKIYLHCNGRNHNSKGLWKITPIQIEENHQRRLTLENQWITRLKTIGRFGLNKKAQQSTNNNDGNRRSDTPVVEAPQPMLPQVMTSQRPNTSTSAPNIESSHTDFNQMETVLLPIQIVTNQ